MIAKHVQKYGCPKSTESCNGPHCSDPNNCFCEYHCSWQKCRLPEYPDNCLNALDYEWKWSSEQMFWMAIEVVQTFNRGMQY